MITLEIIGEPTVSMADAVSRGLGCCVEDALEKLNAPGIPIIRIKDEETAKRMGRELRAIGARVILGEEDSGGWFPMDF